MVNNVRKAALQAVAGSMPTGIYFGTVVNISPLRVQIEQKLTLESSQLLLSSLVQDITVDMTVNHFVEEYSHEHNLPGGGLSSADTHNHNYSGRKSFMIHFGLQVGEKVMLLRMQGGQKYIVLDRIR